MKRMSMFLFSVLTVAILHAQAPAAAVAPAQAQTTEISKVLEIKETNHDFGKIPYGKPAEFDVVIKNISNDSVKLENVKPTCGCTTPKFQAGMYAPGETFKVTLGFNGYTEGPFSKTADIVFGNGLVQQIKFSGVGYKVPEQPAPANGAVQKMKTGGK